jgi:putative transposase
MDAPRYETVCHGGVLVVCGSLIGMRIGPDGKRTIPGVSVPLSEAEAYWRAFLTSLGERAFHGVKFIVSDAHPGLAVARRAVFPSVPWQRCQFHLQQNAEAHVPRLDVRSVVAADIRSLFNCSDPGSAPWPPQGASRLLLQIHPETRRVDGAEPARGLTVHALPVSYRRRPRTRNAIERVNQELKRRSRVVSFVRNEASLLRLVTAILCEISKDWDLSKFDLKMNLIDPPQTGSPNLRNRNGRTIRMVVLTQKRFSGTSSGSSESALRGCSNHGAEGK